MISVYSPIVEFSAASVTLTLAEQSTVFAVNFGAFSAFFWALVIDRSREKRTGHMSFDAFDIVSCVLTLESCSHVFNAGFLKCCWSC